MVSNFKQRFWRTGKWFGGLFLLLFIFRLIYGYLVAQPGINTEYGGDFFSSMNNLRKNYASEKTAFKNDVQQQASTASGQKYEKTASIKAKTAQFEEDEKSVRSIAKTFQAVIQYEQNLGQAGKRELHLLIGVNPDSFDSFYQRIRTIGVIKSQEVTKVDKTNEYRQLNAQKASFEKTLQSLNELKSRGGEITDFVSLHDKILEIESKLQELGVDLGNFDTENEFCTVRLSLYEGENEKKISFIHRVKVALEWTIKYYVLLMIGLTGTFFAIFLLLLIMDKLNMIKAMMNKMNEP